MRARKECICEHIKTSHTLIAKRDKDGKVVYINGMQKNDNVGKCKFPNCKCKKYEEK